MPFLKALVEPIRTALFTLCCFLATLCGSDLTTVFTVWRKYAVKSATVAASPSAGADAGRSATLSTGGNAPLGEVAGDDGYGQGESEPEK